MRLIPEYIRYIERISLHSLVSQNIDCGGVAVHVVAPLLGVSFSSFITSGHHVEVSG